MIWPMCWIKFTAGIYSAATNHLSIACVEDGNNEYLCNGLRIWADYTRTADSRLIATN